MHRSNPILCLCLALILPGQTVATPSFAQSGIETEAEAASEPVERASEGPFFDAMSRLAMVMGSMHFLRELCADADKSVWRSEMSALLDHQQPNRPDRRRLIASFNNGYRAYESTYRHCTPSARLAHNRYQSEGARLSRDIVTRYGN